MAVRVEAHFSRRVVRCFTDGRDPEPIEHGLSEMLAQRIYGLALIWKQWKRGKARYAKLRQLGVRKDLAAQTAGSPLGPWRLANSPAPASCVAHCVLRLSWYSTTAWCSTVTH